jgi:hypothetical protein
MRLPVLAVAFATLLSCAQAVTGSPPPTNRFYFPTGVAFAPAPGSNGVLYVASSNFDRRFTLGAVSAVRLDDVRSADDGGLPPLGAPVSPEGPIQLTHLNLASNAFVEVQTFAARMGQYAQPDGGQLLFLPSQAEGAPLQIMTAKGNELACLYPDPVEPQNCFTQALSLTANALAPADPGVPAAPQPWDVAVDSSGRVMVTHVYSADSPPQSQTNLASYLVVLDANALPAPGSKISNDSFLYLGDIGSWGVVAGARYAYVSGVSPQPAFYTLEDTVIRMVDPLQRNVIQPLMRQQYQAVEARALTVSPDEKRLFVITRSPDALVTLNISSAESITPALTVESITPLPAGPLELKSIIRQDGTQLLAITCQTAGTLVFFDTRQLALVGAVPGIGLEPTDLAVDLRGNQARVYVTNLNDGRVAVVDVTDLADLTTARLVAHIGMQQTCLVQPTDPSCKVSGS